MAEIFVKAVPFYTFAEDACLLSRWWPSQTLYQTRSMILTSQMRVTKWHEQIGDPTAANGILDHIVHNAHRIEMRGTRCGRSERVRSRPEKARPGCLALHRARGRAPCPEPVSCRGILTSHSLRRLFRCLDFLTKLNTYPTIKTPASFGSDCFSDRNPVRLASGLLFGFVGIVSLSHSSMTQGGPSISALQRRRRNDRRHRGTVTVQALVFASLAEPVWPISLDISRVIV